MSIPSSLECDPADEVVLCCIFPAGVGAWSGILGEVNFSPKMSLRSDARMTSLSYRVSSGTPVTSMELMASNRRARQSCEGLAK